MSLRTRLFLSFGSVLVLVCILSYVLPHYLVKKDIDQAAQQIQVLQEKKEKATSVASVLENLRLSIMHKISWNLFGASFIGLMVGLYLLNRVSRKVTKPLTVLAEATLKVEEGKYEGIELPPLGKRHDEVATLSHGFEKMLIALKDREKMRGVLNKVVSKEIASEILKNTIELGGEERIATVLFSDIRGFTNATETIQPRRLINMMNAYLTEMCRIIDENKGVVDKFVGDEVMALYGVPLMYPDHAVKAVSTALKMIKSLRKTNEERASRGLPPVEIGIGIHTGVVVAGNVGSENRLNYTVLGANVNLASRLCSAAKGMQILVSEATIQEPSVRESFLYEELPALSLKGILHPVKVFEIKNLSQ